MLCKYRLVAINHGLANNLGLSTCHVAKLEYQTDLEPLYDVTTHQQV